MRLQCLLQTSSLLRSPGPRRRRDARGHAPRLRVLTETLHLRRGQSTHELTREEGLVARLGLDEGVLQQRRGGRSLLGVLDETETHEVLEFAAERPAHVLWTVRVERGRRLLQGQHQHLQRRVLGIRRVPERELKRGDARGPHVSGSVVTNVGVHDLGAHPTRCTSESAALVHTHTGLEQRARDAKVRDLDLPMLGDEDVACLDVAVDGAVSMEVD